MKETIGTDREWRILGERSQLLYDGLALLFSAENSILKSEFRKFISKIQNHKAIQFEITEDAALKMLAQHLAMKRITEIFFDVEPNGPFRRHWLTKLLDEFIEIIKGELKRPDLFPLKLPENTKIEFPEQNPQEQNQPFSNTQTTRKERPQANQLRFDL